MYLQKKWESLMSSKIIYTYCWFWHKDAMRRHKPVSTLAQVMDCCLTAPSYSLNHCWQIISGVMWCSHKENFNENASDVYTWCVFENYYGLEGYSFINKGEMSKWWILWILRTNLFSYEPKREHNRLYTHHNHVKHSPRETLTSRWENWDLMKQFVSFW